MVDKIIRHKDVIAFLNVLDYEYYFRLVNRFFKNDVTGALLIFNEILNKGFDGHYFINGLSNYFRDLLVCKDPETVKLIEVGDETKERYKAQARAISQNFLIGALQISDECAYKYKNTYNKRLLVEIALIKMAQLTLRKTQEIEPIL